MFDALYQIGHFIAHDPTTLLTSILIAIALVFGLYAHRTNTYGPARQFIPTFMTSLGILGTFLGIVIGLIKFDTNDIDQSIPYLLEGLKTAFLTSIVGMIGTICFKIFTLPKSDPDVAEKLHEQDLMDNLISNIIQQRQALEKLNAIIAGEDGDSLASIMKGMRADIKEANQEHQSNLSKIAFAFQEEKDYSVQGQIRVLRRTINEIHEKENANFEKFSTNLKSQLDDFAKSLSGAATSQIIEALRQVISDFNNNLTEQFGENFKELNSAVEKLLEWQNRYKEHLETLESQFQMAISSIEKTKEAVSVIAEKSGAIPESMSNLESVMGVLQAQIDKLQAELEMLSDVKDKAVNAIPQIGKSIEAMTDSMDKAVNHIALNLDKTATSFSESTSGISSSLQECGKEVGRTADTTKESLIESANRIQELADEFRSHLKGMSEQTKQTVYETLNTTQSEVEQIIKEATKKTSDSIDFQIRKLDDAMTSELNHALQELGNALATISRAVVDQYESKTRKNAQ
ncbi:MAG: hypothetical protein Q3Y13_08070 [Sutterella sp.]|nr:hypothetical protein [Sutterella sp.]